jgi:hypothetical protein
VSRKVRGKVSLTLTPETAAVIVAAPAGSKSTREGKRGVVDRVVVDYADPGMNKRLEH